jgi:O-antigen ligase
VATLAVLWWGALSFGAVYRWASVPLLAACAVLGGVALLRPDRRMDASLRRLAAAMAVVALAIAVQLVPLAPDALRWLTPETERLLQRYALAFAASPSPPFHSLSIAPEATLSAWLAFAALSLLLLGTACSLKRSEIGSLVTGVATLGVVLALVGLAQQAMWNGKIYGFWTPIERGESFGPFVNRNHFAGWMLMGIPLVLGYCYGRVVKDMQHVAPEWRARLVWLASAGASRAVLAGFAVGVMSISLAVTFSRSGILGLVFAIALFGWWVAAHRGPAMRRGLAALYLGAVILVAFGSVGAGALFSRFSERQLETISGRLPAWADAWQIARRFPLAGTGLNTYGVATLFYQQADPEHHYTEAHNDYLQLLAEGGLLVCVPAAVSIGLLAATVRRRFRETSPAGADYWVRVGAVTGLLAMAFQELGEFSLQIPGNAVFFAVLAGIALRSPSTREDASGPARGKRRSGRLRQATASLAAARRAKAAGFEAKPRLGFD